MKILRVVVGVVVVAIIGIAVAAPIGPMPGLLISGTAAGVPDTWGDTQPVREIQLQIGEGPVGRTVIIWVVQVDGDLFVTGQQDAGWTSGIGGGGPVRMLMNGNLYDLEATPVAAGAVEILAAWQAKYTVHYPDAMGQFPPPEEAIRTAVVYRLTARA